MNKIYFAGGCFWGTEHLFSLVDGVQETVAGYANSRVPDPTYEEVCSGTTGAAEAVQVTYNPDIISLTDLITLFFRSINPLTLNRQGNDIGTQYRTGIYYVDRKDEEVVDAMMQTLQRRYTGKIVVESGPLLNFYPAEDYHQDYLGKNPGGYCHISRELFREARMLGKNNTIRQTPADNLRERLSPLQWEVTQNGATEPPFHNEYDNEFRPGIYVDITDGTPLFSSSRKYDSGCGWPAFTRPLEEGLIDEFADYSFGRERLEVRSARSGAHLGHVFNDGPREQGGLRYCINSASLRFIPFDRMDEEGYGEYKKFVEC